MNSKRVNIASYRVKPGDVVTVRERSRNMALVRDLQSSERDTPDYISMDVKGMSATYVRIPELAEVPYPVKMEPNLVVGIRPNRRLSDNDEEAPDDPGPFSLRPIPSAPDHAAVRALVHHQGEEVRPGVVTDHVEVVAGADQVAQVNGRGDEAGLAHQRPGQHISEGSDDQAAASDQRTVGGPVVGAHAEATGEGCTWQALITKQRPSWAMWRMELRQISRSSTVGAHQTSTPLAYMAVRNSGM